MITSLGSKSGKLSCTGKLEMNKDLLSRAVKSAEKIYRARCTEATPTLDLDLVVFYEKLPAVFREKIGSAGK